MIISERMNGYIEPPENNNDKKPWTYYILLLILMIIFIQIIKTCNTPL
jgi:hypothetical protein